MTTISFNADYAHILTKQGFVSTEATRYYLCGVYVHPCVNQPGAFLVATDGHRLGCFYDADAQAPMPATVSLSADALRMTKPHKLDKRTIRVEATNISKEGFEQTRATGGTVTLLDDVGNVLCGKAGDVVDGTYPDWQRVVPSFALDEDKISPLVSYNAAYLAAFGFRHPDMRNGPFITLDQTDGKGPARVLNAHYPNFLGIIMPGRCTEDSRAAMLPAWYLDAPAAVTKVAAE
jgi:hypothetical protein